MAGIVERLHKMGSRLREEATRPQHRTSDISAIKRNAETCEKAASVIEELTEALADVLADMEELFASADELEMAASLARLETPLTFDEDGPKTVKRARAALSRANGEHQPPEPSP